MLLRVLATLSLLVLASDDQRTQPFNAKAVGITDGDTITVLLEEPKKHTLKIRLEGIDAPESSQSFGSKSKEHLNDLVAGRPVKVHKSGEDRYGRTLAFIFVDKRNINAQMVKDGWAWHYKKYNDDEELAALEDEARLERRGLWADESPLPPWEFRARKRGDTAETPEPSGSSEDPALTHWLNTSSNVRHNSSCEHFEKTKRGRRCKPDDGKPCGICKG